MNLWMGVITLALCFSGAKQSTDRANLYILGDGALYMANAEGRMVKKCDVSASQVEWSSDGSTLLLFDSASGRVSVLSTGSANPRSIGEGASFAKIDKAGKHIMVGYRTNPLTIVDLESGTDVTYKAGSGATCATWSPDSTQIAFVSSGDLWFASSDGKIAFVMKQKVDARSISWSPDGRLIAYADGSSVRIFEVAGGKEVTVLKKAVDSIQWSPDSKLLLTTSPGASDVWDIASGSSHPNPSEYSNIKWLAVGKLMGVKKDAVYVFSGYVARSDAKVIGRLDSSRTALDAAARPSAMGVESILIEPDESTLAQDETLLRASVSSVDLTTGAVTLSVDSVRFRNGSDVFFGKPASVTALLGLKGSSPVDKRYGRQWLSAQDAKKDMRVWVVVGPTSVESDVIDLRGFLVPQKQPRETLNPSRAKITNDGADLSKYVVPLIFPVLGGVKYSDTFLYPRDGGKRRHMGQDLMAKKMRPLLAVFNGVVSVHYSGKGGHNTLMLVGDNGWVANYYHINNDNPGTDDGKAPIDYVFAPGLKSGDRVVAGQLIAFVGDSGNAEGTGAHVHFELEGGDAGRTINAYSSLKASTVFQNPVARASMLGWKAGRNEIRLDGFIQSIQEDTRSIVVDVSCLTDDGSKPKAITVPTRKMVVLGPEQVVTICGSSLSIPFSELKVGMPIVVVGRQESTGLRASQIGVELPKLLGDSVLLSAMKARLMNAEPASTPNSR